MFSPFDQNQSRLTNNPDGNAQDGSRFSHQNADPENNGFSQKLLSENGEGRIEVPGDIKILFETAGDRFSDVESSTGISNWDRSEGDRTPVGLFHRPPTLKSSSFKVTSSTSYNQRNTLLNKQRVTFSPKLTSTQSIQKTQKLGNSFFNMDRLREDRPNSYSPPPKKFSDASDETLSIKKISIDTLKTLPNSNNFCPFCNKLVQNLDNPEETYAYESKGSHRTYLAHSECNPALNNSPTFPKISVHSDIVFANIAESTFCSAINSIETLSDSKKIYFVKLEAFHPISSSKLFKLERICNEICTTIDENQFLYVNFDSQNSSLLELNNYTFPFNEFRMVVTVYQTQSNEDAYTYEFNVNISNSMLLEESKEKLLEISFNQGGNCDVTIGIDHTLVSNKDEFLQKLNKPQYFHPDLQNILLTLKYLAISFPLKRVQMRPILRSFNDNPSHFAKESQLSYGSLTGKSNRLKVFKGNDSDCRIDSLDSVNNLENTVGGSMPGLSFLPPSQNFLHQQNSLHPEIPSIYNTKTSLTADNSPNNRKPLSPSSKMAYSPSKFDPSTTFSAAISNSETQNPENSIPAKQNEDVDSDFKLDENLDKLVSLARTYRGSKVLQDFLVKANKTDLDKVITRFSNNMIELMLDPYANYMIQILAKHCQAEQRLVLLQKIAPAIYKIACDKKGTYALQTIVSLINTHAEDLLMKSALGNYILDLALDIQGNHVIQKLINAVNYKNIDFIYQPLVENFLHVATHSSGSLVFKQLIIKVEKNINMKTTIIHLVCQEMENLVQDPYGNYVIQYALEYYPKDSISIQQKIINKLIPYSSQKFSSNIIEKSLAVGDYFFRKKVAAEILKNDRLSDLLKNKYGNYVILHTLAICDSKDKQFIMQGIHRCVYSFQGTKYKLRWIKFLDENPLNIQWKALSPSSKSPFNRGNNVQFESFNDMYNNSTTPEISVVEVINRDEDLQKLEIVKKIWRDMNKEEKSGTPHNGKAHSNKSFGGYEDFSDSTNGSPIHGNFESGNYYPEQFNLYVSPTKMDDQRLKWY